jgi:hypothetical protein
MIRFIAMQIALGLAWIAVANAATTKVVRYNAASMTVTQHVKGSCWTTSIASTRGDAYRCMVGNAIYDPCFMRGASSVVCPENLVDNSGLAIKLTKPLPPSASPQAAQPWAMVLASHIACNRATGTVDPEFPFYCEGIAGACSAPQHSKPEAPYFVSCAGLPVENKPRTSSHWVATTIYE